MARAVAVAVVGDPGVHAQLDGGERAQVAGTSVGPMPATEANALFLAGSAWRYLICFSTSQLATLRVPPYRPGRAAVDAPNSVRATPRCPAGRRPDRRGGAVLGRRVGEGVGARAWPAAWRKISPSEPACGASEPPSGRVKTTVRTTAATTATAISATRGDGTPPGAGGAPAPLPRRRRSGAAEAGRRPRGRLRRGPTAGRRAVLWGGRTTAVRRSRALLPDVGFLRRCDALAPVQPHFYVPLSLLCAPVPCRPQADADGPPGGRAVPALLSVAA